MSNTTTLPATLATSAVDCLAFVRISDTIRPQWVEWEVSFRYEGRDCVGYLCGSPRFPETDNEETIHFIELA